MGALEASVLVVEDNPVNQLVAEEMLAKIGCSADLVENGREALDALAEGSYDLILMDVQMPEMDGFVAAGKIREREAAEKASQRIPIVALTANAMEGDRTQCLAAGMDDYLSKPFTATALRKVRSMSRWNGSPNS